MVQVTYYLEVVSSWCFWAEPAWAELKRRYEGLVMFDWRIAAMPPEAYPVSKAQCEWFYRRSGSIVRSAFMLNSGWLEPDVKQYLVPNYVAQSAKDAGVSDDRVRLAIANAALREGKKVGRWEEAISVGARASGLGEKELRARAQAPETAERIRITTEEFKALQVTQRPAFLIRNGIGDRALFSGIVRAEPLMAAIDALLADEAAYASWSSHFGAPPRE